MRELVLPALANHHGTLFAGQGLQLMAKTAFLAARSLAQREVVMAGVTGIDFLAPVPVGHEIVLRGWVSRVGRSSMTVCVTASTSSASVTPLRRAKAMCERSWSGRFIAMSALTVTRLRSRGERPGRAQTSPKSTSSVNWASLGAMSPSSCWARDG